MSRTKKVATNIPVDLLEQATDLTGLNQTQALIEGLRQLIAERKRRQLLSMKGKLQIRSDTARTRQRRRI